MTYVTIIDRLFFHKVAECLLTIVPHKTYATHWTNIIIGMGIIANFTQSKRLTEEIATHDPG